MSLIQAKVDLMAQQAKLSESEGLMDKTELRASIDGTVSFLEVKVGKHATTVTDLVRIADES